VSNLDADGLLRQGLRVKIMETKDPLDRAFTGRTGRITRYSNHWNGQDVYMVALDNDENRVRAFYRSDFVIVEVSKRDQLMERVKVLQAETAKLEKELENIEAGEELAELGPGSVVSWAGTTVVKVDEDKWHWFYTDEVGLQHHSNSGDSAVTSEVIELRDKGTTVTLFPADKD
jgi:hypothetical protein